MTPERLQEIKEERRRYGHLTGGIIDDLLAEVDKLTEHCDQLAEALSSKALAVYLTPPERLDEISRGLVNDDYMLSDIVGWTEVLTIISDLATAKGAADAMHAACELMLTRIERWESVAAEALPISLCTWCEQPSPAAEREAHNLSCAKSPAVARRREAVALLRALEALQSNPSRPDDYAKAMDELLTVTISRFLDNET
jgi:hypothetical protein